MRACIRTLSCVVKIKYIKQGFVTVRRSGLKRFKNVYIMIYGLWYKKER